MAPVAQVLHATPLPARVQLRCGGIHHSLGVSGKSSVAKVVAERLGLLYVDSGSMYRAVTLHCLYVQSGALNASGMLVMLS